MKQRRLLKMFSRAIEKRVFVYGIFLLLLILPSAFAEINQDDYCNLINSSMTISQCNDIWNLVTQKEVNNITQVINNTKYFSIDDYKDDILDVIDDDVSDMIAQGIEDYAESIGLDLSKYQYDKEYEYRIKMLELNATKDDCDIACQMKKTLQSQLEMELIRSQFCDIMPNLQGCKVNSATNQTELSAEESELSEKMQNLENTLGNINNKLMALENEPKKETQSNYFLIILLILIAVALGIYGYFSNKKIQGIFLPKDKVETLQKDSNIINQNENQRKTLLDLAKKRQQETKEPDKKPLDFVK